jgi:hypothetical protein
MLHYGRRTHNNRAVFYGLEGVIMGSIMGSQNIMGSDYGSNISKVTTRLNEGDFPVQKWFFFSSPSQAALTDAFPEKE